MAPAKAVDAVLAALISGPGKDSILHPTIPSGTVVRSIRIEGEVAVLDFSAEFITNHWGGSSAEEMTVYSIVNTLTELPFVRAVTIVVEGKPIGPSRATSTWKGRCGATRQWCAIGANGGARVAAGAGAATEDYWGQCRIQRCMRAGSPRPRRERPCMCASAESRA